MEIKSLKSQYCSPDGHRSWKVSWEDLNSHIQSDVDKAGAGKNVGKVHVSVKVPGLHSLAWCRTKARARTLGLQPCPRRKQGRAYKGLPVRLADVKIDFSSRGCVCWPATDLPRKACCPQPWRWGRNPQQKGGGGCSKADRPPSEGCEQTAATISACGLQ